MAKHSKNFKTAFSKTFKMIALYDQMVDTIATASELNIDTDEWIQAIEGAMSILEKRIAYTCMGEIEKAEL